MKTHFFRTTLIIAASWLVPVVALAVPAPPGPDVPFFSWLAVPVVAVAGQRLLKKKKSGDSGRL